MSEEQYSKVTRRMWSDDKFRKLSRPKPNAQSLWLYLLTGKHCTAIPGLLSVGVLGLAEELEWPVAATRKCLQEIVDAGMAIVDAAAKLIWLPNSIRKHNMPANPSVVLGWATPWKLIPECDLRAEAAASMLVALEEEDGRRASFNKPTGLATAFQVVLGERRLADSSLKVGRPRRQWALLEEHGAEHRVPHGVCQGVEHGGEQGAELQDQDQEQEQEDTHSPRAHTREAPEPSGPPALAELGAGLDEASEDLIAIVKRYAPTNAYARQMADRLAEGRPLTADQRRTLRDIDAQHRGSTAGSSPRPVDPNAERVRAYYGAKWARAAKEPYACPAADLGPAERLWAEAVDASERARGEPGGVWAPGAEDVARHWIDRFFADKDPKIREKSWPIAWLPKNIGTYGLPREPKQRRQPSVQEREPAPVISLDEHRANAEAALALALAGAGNGGTGEIVPRPRVGGAS